MKAFDTNVELQIIKTVCDSPSRFSVLGRLNLDYFGSDSAIEVFNRVSSLVRAGKPVPSTDVLKNDEALTDESRAFISAVNAGYLKHDDDIESALTILDKYRKARILFKAINDAVEVLKENDPQIDEVVSSMESALQLCHSGQDKSEMIHYSASNADAILKEITEDLEAPPEGFIPSGYMLFDKNTGGFRRKNVIAIASTPGGGKSAMALQMAVNQYLMGFNVCFVSFEMDHIEIKYRMLSSISKIDHGKINLKRLTKKMIQYIEDKFREFLLSSPSGNRLTIWCPTREMTISEISMETKALNYDIFYVDYIGLLKQDPNKALWESLGDQARAAKMAANSHNAAWVLLAQFDDKESKLKYSKAIEANAHFVWVWENGQKEKESGIIEVKQLKARNAGTYPFFLSRDFSTMSFTDFHGVPPTDSAHNEEQRPKGIPKMPELGG